MRWLALFVALLCCTSCGDDMYRRPGARFNRGRVSSAGVSTIPFSSFWDGYWDVRLYGLTDTQACPTLLSQIGTVSLVPSGTIVYDADGLANAGALLFTPSSGLVANGLSFIANGDDLPLTVMVRAQHAVESSQALWGFGKSTSATQDFHEGFRNAGGNIAQRKDSLSEATVVIAGDTADVALQDYIAAWVTDGHQAWIYVDGALEPNMPQALETLSITIDRFAFGAANRNSLLFGLDGWLQRMCLSRQAATADMIAQMTAFWTTPALAGKPVWFLGDSITQGSGDVNVNGFRKAVYDRAIAQGYGLDFIGAKHNGTFADNDHGGYSGFNISNITGVANTFLGNEKPYHGVRMVILLSGTNNMGQGATPFNNPGTMNEYADLLDTIASLEPNAWIVVTTLPPIDAATFPTPAANVGTFNAALPAIWDTYDTNHPSRHVVRWNANSAIGAWSSTNFADAVHPNATGYALLAGAVGTANTLINAVDSTLAGL